MDAANASDSPFLCTFCKPASFLRYRCARAIPCHERAVLMFAMMSVHSLAAESRPLTLDDRPRNYLISDVAKMTFDSVDQVPRKQWKVLRGRLSHHAKHIGCKPAYADNLAQKIVEAFQEHRKPWNPTTDPNLFEFLKGVVTTVARMPHDQRQAWFDGDLPKTTDVRDVIESLPTIALMVDRLNGLLNPVRPPESVDASLREELVAVRECCLRQAQTIRELRETIDQLAGKAVSA